MPIELIELQQPWGYFLLRELMLCGPGNVISMSFVLQALVIFLFSQDF